MAIILNHTIVPARNKESAARFFARIFGLSFDGGPDHFAPVRVNETLTFLFDDDSSFKSHHYAFHVSDAEFDAILQRVQEAGLSYGSAPGASTTASSTIGMAAGASTSGLLTITCSN
jgi:catechol 2,3-dioxygenase-like lactoylglutathione lyase family enzyme